MPIIDAGGYFGGDRFDSVSDSARAVWPSFFLASNGLARLELSYRKVVAVAFYRWKRHPTEQQFWTWVREFEAAYLLYTYKDNGSIWGQWDTSEKLLPRHKTASDAKSPAPPSEPFLEWKQQYLAQKADNSNDANLFGKFRKVSENLHDSVRGVGVGVGVVVGGGVVVGEGKNKYTPKPARKNGRRGVDPAVAEWFEGAFWPSYWLKKGKFDALMAANSRLITEDLRLAALEGMWAQLPEMLSRSADKRPYAQGWINGSRWNDELISQSQPAAETESPWLQNQREQARKSFERAKEISNGPR